MGMIACSSMVSLSFIALITAVAFVAKVGVRTIMNRK